MTSIAPTRSDLARPVAHRMMSDDLIRLTIAAEGIATGRTPCSDRRAVALSRWVALLGVEIRHFGRDGRSGRALAPLLEAVEAGASDLVTARESQRRTAAVPLAVALAGLRDHLIDALEGACGTEPLAWRHGEEAEWGFRLPRMLDVTSAAEQAQRRAAATAGGRALMTLLTLVTVPLHRRRERLVFAC